VIEAMKMENSQAAGRTVAEVRVDPKTVKRVTS